MDKGINSLLETKTEQRKLLTLSEKERRKYLRNKERQLRKFQELLYSRPSMNKSQQDIALMLAADKLRDLDLTTRETNKNRPTIESLDSKIQRTRTEKQMQQLNFANGGRPPVGRPSIVGERGPELFVPDRAGTIIPNHAMGSTNIVVNVDASGSSVEGDAGQSEQLGSLIASVVQATIIDEQRAGGLLNR